MRPCMHCHVQARVCLRMRSRVHLNLVCVRLAYMRAQAIVGVSLSTRTLTTLQLCAERAQAARASFVM